MSASACWHQLTTFKRALMKDDRAFCHARWYAHGFPPLCTQGQNQMRLRDSQKMRLSPETPPTLDTDEPPASASEPDHESTSVQIDCDWRSVEMWRVHARGRSQRKRRGADLLGSAPVRLVL